MAMKLVTAPLQTFGDFFSRQSLRAPTDRPGTSNVSIQANEGDLAPDNASSVPHGARTLQSQILITGTFEPRVAHDALLDLPIQSAAYDTGPI